MQRDLFGDAIEYVLSRFPDEVVVHFAKSQSEFLRGVRACVVNCVDTAMKDIDARVEGSRKRRSAAASPAGESDSARVHIEEEGNA